MRTRGLSCVLFLSIFIASCEKDFTVTTEWQESYAVYSLLNLKDSAQYVRINRVFLSSDDPSQYFQVADSVNVHAEDFEVTLVPYLDEVPEESFYFFPTTEYVKEDGLFSLQNYAVFKSARYLQPDRIYRLKIRNQTTGFEMWAETELLGRRTIENTFKETRYYDINQYHPELIDYDGDLNPGQYQKKIERFLYYEYKGNEVLMKYVDWRSPWQKQGEGGNRGDAPQFSDEFLRYLAEYIHPDPAVKRKAVGLDKMLLINDDELTIFIEFAENQSSGHYIPDMTNFNNGTGILASRYYYTYFAMKLRKETIDTLAYGRFTGQLRFADSDGNWPPE